MQILPDKGNSICCIVNNTVCLTKSEQNLTITGLVQEHISVTKGSEESPAQVHKQSLNLCGTVFLSTSLSVCVRARFLLLQDVSQDWLLRSCATSISELCVLSTMVSSGV